MDIVREIEDCEKTGAQNSDPVKKITVVECGESGEADPNDPYPSNPKKYEGEEPLEQVAEKIRTRGKDFKAALRKYKKAIKYAEDGSEQFVKSWGNIAAVSIMEKKWNSALKAANTVLKYLPEDFKALSRKGQALFRMSDFSEAK